MRDMNSSSTSNDWSRDLIVTSGAVLDDPSAVAAGVAALVGVGEVVGCVAVDDWLVEDAGWSGMDWTEVGGTGVDVDAESLSVGDC